MTEVRSKDRGKMVMSKTTREFTDLKKKFVAGHVGESL